MKLTTTSQKDAYEQGIQHERERVLKEIDRCFENIVARKWIEDYEAGYFKLFANALKKLKNKIQEGVK